MCPNSTTRRITVRKIVSIRSTDTSYPYPCTTIVLQDGENYTAITERKHHEVKKWDENNKEVPVTDEEHDYVITLLNAIKAFEERI